MKSLLILGFFLSYLTYSECAGGSHWGYGEDLTGPHNWHKLFDNSCSGRYQSPIDIQREYTEYDPTLNDFAIWHDPPKPGSKFYVLNNGHTIQVNTFGPFFISNGGLKNVYSTAQFHFHWGEANHKGSEHTVEGKASPIELHVVSYDADTHKTISKAMKEPEGLAVLGVLFDVVEEDNPALEKIIQNFNVIRDPEVRTEVELDALPIRDFLPKDTTKYFRYRGSLTTPGCFESVVWTVFEDKQTISQRQLEEFRKILQKKAPVGGGKSKKHKRSLQKEQEAAAETVLDEIGIRGDKMKELDLALQMEDQRRKEAEQFKKEHSSGNGQQSDKSSDQPIQVSNSSKSDVSYTVKDNKGGSKADNMDDVPIAYIQEMLWNNYRPVQPINDRTVYRSFKLYSPKEKVVVMEPAYRSRYESENWRNSANFIVTSSSVFIMSLFLSIASFL